MKNFYFFTLLILSSYIYAQCPLPNSAFVGDYELTQVTPIHSVNGVQTFEDQVVKLKHGVGTNKRKFSAIYLEALSIGQPSTDVTFTFNCDNDVIVDTGLETGLTCDSSSSITLGSTNTTGTYNPNNDSSFTLILEEYIDNGGCEVTSPIITEFILTKKDCSTPQNLSVDDVDNSTAIISWDDYNGPNTTFEVEYGQGNFTKGNGIALSNLTTPSVTLNNLQTDIVYNFYITTFCGNNSQVTIGPHGLSVPEDCDIIFSDLPINEDFENFETFQNCYSTLSEDSNNSSWDYLEFYFNSLSYFAINYESEVQKEDYLFTPAIDMIANNTYNISFLYNAVDTNFGDANENLEVLVAQDTTVASLNNAVSIFNDVGITQNGNFNTIIEEALESSVSFIPSSSGTYHLVFKSTGSPKPGNQSTGHLLLFEYSINELIFLSSENNEINDFNYFVNRANQLILSANQAFDKIELHNLLGQQVISQTLSAQDERVDLNSLTSGVYLAKVQINDSTKTFKIVKK